ncbi:hypothetical protein ACLQ2N_16605 [Streptomyces sp. DT224]|uniref:hypothetical protein n=1 Tax=Streptomyces sp. DT224 TaxID=3393426 RepID=UPI003CF9100D
MAAKTTLAALSGLAAGIACTVASVHGVDTSTFGGILLLTAVRLFPGLCITLVSLAVLRRWMVRHDTRTRAEYAALAEERRQYGDEYQRRSAELYAREQRLAGMSEHASWQMLNLTNRLSETLLALTASRRELAELQADYDELANDHNQVIRETLQERADVFSRRRPAPSRPTPTPPAFKPPLPPPSRLRLPIYQLPDQPQHDRTADDVGEHA